jgi:hypothetical protein
MGGASAEPHPATATSRTRLNTTDLKPFTAITSTYLYHKRSSMAKCVKKKGDRSIIYGVFPHFPRTTIFKKGWEIPPAAVRSCEENLDRPEISFGHPEWRGGDYIKFSGKSFPPSLPLGQ